MDRANYKQSSSSFAVDLFGPKDSSSKSSNSSDGFFGSIFGPQASMVPGREPSPQDFANAYGSAQHETTKDNKSVKGNTMKKGVDSNYDENKKSVHEPCYYNSSIYYGGQEIYSPSTRKSPPQNFKKDGGNADQNESNSSCASRGNWWQAPRSRKTVEMSATGMGIKKRGKKGDFEDNSQ
ncbi:hypothetical protein C2S51_014516 [Perilla frutescens var. frutescens]|nr:hypothetical protein C2S51_014516 [Perilla frutescens var. frutescens]